MASFMKEYEHLKIQLKDIKSATNNFDENKVIGNGGFGKVYEGELCHSNSEKKSLVALKRLDRKYGQGDPQFWKEIMMLSQYRHMNLISLLGFCNEEGEMILVYEYASRGSLERYLNDVTLTWTQRIKICIDAANGLSFLHEPNERQQRVLHCDVKSANILLDDNLNAKVSDFGLSKTGSAGQQYSVMITNAVGTPGYCDPLYMETYQLTKESDVYSFGVVLFEVLSGKLCVENINGQLKVYVPFWKKCYEEKKLDAIVFQGLMQQMNPGSLETFGDIAYKCLKRFHEERPAMSFVVEKLEESLAFQEGRVLKMSKVYEEIAKAAVPPLKLRSLDELKVLLTKGLYVNEGKTRWLSVNGKGEHIESIYIEACLNLAQFQASNLQDPSHYLIVNSRSSAIGFLKPFGCHVMILNTLDNLVKFEEKGDEGTKDAASQEVKKGVSSLRYIALPNWTHDALLEFSSSKPQDYCSTKVPEGSGNPNPTASTSNPPTDQMETLTVETPIPTVSSPVPTAYSTDSQEPSSDTRLISKRVANQEETPSLDNILSLTNRSENILGVKTNSDESNGVEADISNKETAITSSPTPTLRIHKDHPKSQIIGPMDTPIQTRNKSKEISDALQDPSWVEAMQEELLQFKIQNVWTLVDCPKRVRPIGTKWVLENKKDERGIVIRNKARLVAQGHTQEEGIDYDEVFGPVVRIEAIRLFLAYASFMGFTIYQMDIKSAFLSGTIDGEMYVMQPDPPFLTSPFLNLT
nr:protein kinase-like domain, phloem protein 2-like protein [Tanacetum cinerariifolium]